jgi:hypothetical protein
MAQNIRLVNKNTLLSFCKKGRAVKVGSTNDPERRWYEYPQQFRRMTMFVAETTNMYYAENRLLDNLRRGTHKNIHLTSNAQKVPGCVYVFVRMKKLRKGRK